MPIPPPGSASTTVGSTTTGRKSYTIGVGSGSGGRSRDNCRDNFICVQSKKIRTPVIIPSAPRPRTLRTACPCGGTAGSTGPEGRCACAIRANVLGPWPTVPGGVEIRVSSRTIRFENLLKISSRNSKDPPPPNCTKKEHGQRNHREEPR
jgi:hypothetical protein